MKNKLAFFLIILLLLIPTTALAQSYYFGVEKETVHVYWEADGTLDLIYEFIFVNQPGAHAIEYVDVGLPNYNYSDSNISADVNGQALTDISSSGYEGSGSGVAVGLGSNAIQPGNRGTVRVFINGIDGVLFPDTEADDYVSAVFMPTYFGSEYVTGSTDITVIFHLPPGVNPEEPRWHQSPSGFSSSPITGLDSLGQITYTWRNPQADMSSRYKFGASFPSNYVPASAVTKPSLWQQLGISPEAVTGILCVGGFLLFFVLIIVVSVSSTRKRKLKYLPPKIRIEGHGIKRGLTAIEAAILLERPADKVFTMILFSLIQKNAAKVLSQEPLKLEFTDPLPEQLRKYETQFIEAFKNESSRVRKTALQDMMIALIKSVGKKMEGFSHKESVRYYEDIIKRAWKQVEDADTPEVKSEKFNDHMGWTMLDGEFEDKTQDVFRRGPVYLPIWWNRYDPTFRGTQTAGPSGKITSPSRSGGGALPNLPGGEFAASMATGISNFSSDVVGNITDFTSRITQKTNPVPKSTSSSGGGWSSGGGSSCACA
ncbi:MAG: hypothetical protein HQ574_02625, partial [Chloroflexi bacterium]|nr:hypothetical protein [Chloroflexota bacterium]